MRSTESTENTEAIAARLRVLMALTGLTQTAVAERAGLSPSLVSRYVKGRAHAPPRTLARLVLAIVQDDLADLADTTSSA